jgi:hypothetical protein
MPLTVILQGAWFKSCGQADRRGSGIVTRISFWSEGSCRIDHHEGPVRSGGPAQTYGLRSPRHSVLRLPRSDVRMWFPLWCYVNDREQASPHIGKQPAVAATAAVVRSDRLVQLCGLFPALDRSARVLVPATSSPTGLGSRSLSLMELGGLWDIPISVMDSLVGPASGNIYRALFDTPPTKSLLVGADSLLTTSFRGGLQGLLAGRPRKGGNGGGYLGVTSGLSRNGHVWELQILWVVRIYLFSHQVHVLVRIGILVWQPHDHWSHSILIF